MTLERAVLVPFDQQSQKTDESKAITLDFNPETLTIKVQNTLQDVPGRKDRQRVQFVGSTTATLSFDAIFDGTRPKTGPGESGATATQDSLDVRKRTKTIVGFLSADTTQKYPAPTRVEFRWGSIIFDGIIDTYSEVLDYFSPEGVPLRSKVSISIKENKFEYQTKDEVRAQLAQGQAAGADGDSATSGGQSPTSAFSSLGATINDASDIGSQNGLDSLLSIGVSGGLSFDASLSVSAGLSISAGVSVSAGLDLGVGVDLGFSAGASFDASVSAAAAIDVFGGAPVQAAVGRSGVDLSASAGPPPVVTHTPTPTSWAPSGPTAGSTASALAAVVNQQRASGTPPTPPDPSGGTFTATAIVASAAPSPLPVRGSPPLVSAQFGPGPAGAVFIKAPVVPATVASLAGDLPSWQTLPASSSNGPAVTTSNAPTVAASGPAPKPARGCRACGRASPRRGAPCGCRRA